MYIKCTWEYELADNLCLYHNVSKSEANVRVLVLIRLRKSMHTDLKYPYASTQKDALWHLRRGVGVESGFQVSYFILWRFIFTEFMYVNRWPLRSDEEGRMTDETKLQKRATTAILTHAPV